MSKDSPTSRRSFLERLGLAAAAGLAGATDAGFAADDAVNRMGGGPHDLRRALSPTGADLGSVFPLVNQLPATSEYPYSYLSGRFSSLEEYKVQAREKLLDLLLYRPESVDPRAEVVDRVDRGDFIQEKVVFSTSPVFRIAAYVLIPKGLDRPAPAIVDLHSHGGMRVFGKEKIVDLGDNHPVMQEYHERVYAGRPTSTELVRRGYVVIATDAFLFGERRVLRDEDLRYGWDRSQYSTQDVQYLNQQCARKESTLVKAMILSGLSWLGIVTWDDRRTVDYLVTRPEVDPQRIGCLGISFGGHRSLCLAGLDERIAAACVVGFMSTVVPMIKAHLDTHSWVHFPPTVHRYFDMPDMVSMMAPKPLLVEQCSQDSLFPPEGMQAAVAKLAAVYEKAGASDRFSGRFYDIPHRFSRPMQEDAFAWFDRHLKG